MMISIQYEIQALIGGEDNVITVKFVGFIDQWKLYQIVNFLRSNGYQYIKEWRVWFKESKNVEEDMNNLENTFIELEIVYINEHELFKMDPRFIEFR